MSFTFPLALFSSPLVLPVTTNLILHLDSSNLTSITKDGSNLVSQWNDLSGLNNHVYQSNSSFKPTWTSAIQNNLDGIYWNNGNQVLRTSNNIGGKHCFIVVKHIESSSTFGFFRRLIDRGDDTDSTTYSLFGILNETNYSPLSFSRNISSTNIWINRTQTVNASPIANPKLVEFITTNPVNVGLLGIGGNSNRDINQSMLGYIFEVLLYSDTKNSNEINLISNYLNIKWNIY